MSSGRAWSRSEDRILRRSYPELATPKVAELLGRSLKSAASRAKVLGLRKTLGHGGRNQWTQRADRIVRRLYPNTQSEKLAKRLRVPLHALYQRAKRLGLKKSAEYMASPAACRLRRGDNVGATFRFLPGHVPANRGLRRPGYAPGRMAETQFKKGRQSPNAMPLWTFRFNSDGYLLLKTGKRMPKPNDGWEYVHRLIWEQANGPLPNWTESRLWWKDRDRGNCALSNLELVTTKEHMSRTTIHRLPPELKSTIFQAGVLKRRIREYEEAHAEKQAV